MDGAERGTGTEGYRCAGQPERDVDEDHGSSGIVVGHSSVAEKRGRYCPPDTANQNWGLLLSVL